jgi:hypothetical protein
MPERGSVIDRVVEQVVGELADDAAGHLVDAAIAVALGAELPPCGIRRRCQWFIQRGVTACHACPLVAPGGRSPDPAA